MKLLFRTLNCPQAFIKYPVPETVPLSFALFPKRQVFTGYDAVTRLCLMSLKETIHYWNKLWLRRQTTKFNGVSYIVQRGAEAVFSEMGLKTIRDNIDYYLDNARIIADTLTELGIWFTGGGIRHMYGWNAQIICHPGSFLIFFCITSV